MDYTNVWVAVVGAVGGGFVGILTWLGHRAGATASRDSAEINTRSAEWKAITETIREHSEERIDRLEGRVVTLEKEVETFRTKYWKAIYYGRAWRLRHPESVPHVDVPPEIADDL